jgi:DNA-binding NarL/FixJ family response regulator
VIRVLVADDQAAVRGGFAALIDAQEGMQVAGEATNGREAVDLARRVFPHVVLMDIRMPVLDGLEATRLICADRHLERTRVLVLTTFDADEYVYGALRAGASGFLLKDTCPRELLHAIEVVAAGDALIAPRITRRLIAEFAARSDPAEQSPRLAELTDRERDPAPRRAGPQQRRDRGTAGDQPTHRQDARQQRPSQARLPRPRRPRRTRLRDRAHHRRAGGSLKASTGMRSRRRCAQLWCWPAHAIRAK